MDTGCSRPQRHLQAHIGRMLAAAALLACAPAVHAGEPPNQFVHATLKHGAAVDVPRAWELLRGQERQAIGTPAGATVDLSGYAETTNGTETLLAAIFVHPKLYAGVAVTTAAVPGVTADLPARMSEADVAAGQSQIRQGVEASQRKLGNAVSGWTALKKEELGGRVVMHTSYVRSGKSSTRHVDLYKVFAKGRVFDIALTSDADALAQNRPVLEKIAASFKAP